MFDAVKLAMIRAADDFGKDGRTFNAAGFSQALTSIAGVKDQIDGRLCRAILCGRDDVTILSGGAHFAMLAERERDQ